MFRKFIVFSFIFLFISSSLFAQMNLTGRMGVEWIDSQNGAPADEPSNNIVNHGKSTFLYRMRLYLDMPVSERSLILSDIRVEGYGIKVEIAAIRLYLNDSKTFMLQAGVLGTPIGNVLARRSSKYNPFIQLPLLYEYRTQLQDDGDLNYQPLLDNRGTGIGLRVLDQAVYSPGAMVQATLWDKLDFSAGIYNSAPSNPYMYNEHNQLNFAQRIGYRPFLGLNIGFSFGIGPYREATSTDENPQQIIYDVDFSYERGHLAFFGEALFNQWESSLAGETLEANGFYLETKYKFLPRLFLAVRAGLLQFEKIKFPDSTEHAWDDNIQRYEFGVGYYVARETLAKLVLQKNITDRVDIEDDYVALQLSAGF